MSGILQGFYVPLIPALVEHLGIRDPDFNWFEASQLLLSAIVVLLGGISLVRLPVDLMPDISQPTITVNVTYAGVGPLERVVARVADRTEEDCVGGARRRR